MDDRTKLIEQIFRRVKERVADPKRSESLQLFFQRWKGTNAGIEAWLKVEFVAAIEEKLARIETGGASGRGVGLLGKKYPDFIIKDASRTLIEVEMKAATNWQSFGKRAISDYKGRAIFFLCAEQHNNFEMRDKSLRKHGQPCSLVRVCEDVDTGYDWLLGFLDLGAPPHP